MSCQDVDNFLLWVEKNSSFANFGVRVGSWGFQMCCLWKVFRQSDGPG